MSGVVLPMAKRGRKSAAASAPAQPAAAKKPSANPVNDRNLFVVISQLESIVKALQVEEQHDHGAENEQHLSRPDEDGSDDKAQESASLNHRISPPSAEISVFAKELSVLFDGATSPLSASLTSAPGITSDLKYQRIMDLLYEVAKDSQSSAATSATAKTSTRTSRTTRSSSPSQLQAKHGDSASLPAGSFKYDRMLLLTLFNLIDRKFGDNVVMPSRTKLSFDSIFYSLENDAELKEHIPQILQTGTSTGIPVPLKPVVNHDAEQPEGNSDDFEMNPAAGPDTSMVSNQTGAGASDFVGTSILHNLQDPITAMSELDPNQNINAPAGLKYLYSFVGKNLANPAQIKSIKQIINDVIPSKSKWAKDGRQGQEKMLGQMEKVLSELRNYTAHSFPFLKPVQKREAPGYHDIIKTPMDLSTVLKKLKAFQYFDKQDFAKDLDLIWENCLLYNTSPDSIYRVHALKMREKCEHALKRVIEEEEEEEAEEESVIEEIVVKEESLVSSIPPTTAAPTTAHTNGGNLADLEYQMMVDVASEADSNAPGGWGSTIDATAIAAHQGEEKENVPVIRVEENYVDLSVDECFLTNKWKLATNVYRAQLLKTRQEVMNLSFGERPALISKQEDMDIYIANQERNALLLQLESNLSVVKKKEEGGPVKAEEGDEEMREGQESEDSDSVPNPRPAVVKKVQAIQRDLEKVSASFFLPELYPVGVPFSHIPSNIPSYLRDYFVYEDEAPNPIPVPPLPSLSEYPQIHPDMTSPLNYHLMNNVTEFKRLKQVYQKIIAKQQQHSFEEGAIAAIAPISVLHPVPSVRGGPFQRNYTIDQLPDFNIDESTSHAALERVAALLISHQGFDTIHKSPLSTFTEVMAHVLTGSAKLLKAFRDEMGKENSPMELLVKVLAEMGIEDAGSLSTYIERDVVRHGKKLHDLRTKLESAWVNQGKEEAGPSLLRNNQERDMDVDMDQHADGIINGTFLEDMGVDFLNVKELGLDIKIPAELWNRKNEIRANARIRRVVSQSIDNLDPSRANTQTYPVPDPWAPVDPSTQIGLLATFYRRLQTVPDGLLEDDQKPKSKEAKLLIKYALAGGRKTVTAPKKKSETKSTKPKKERKKKKKDLATVAAANAANAALLPPS